MIFLIYRKFQSYNISTPLKKFCSLIYLLPMLYTHIINMLIYTYTNICWIHTDAMNNRQAKSSLKNMPLTLFERFERVLLWEGVGVRTELQYMATSVVSFSFSRAAQPEAQRPTLLGAGFLYRILSPTGLQTPSGIPRAPSAGCGFPYHISSLTRIISNSLTFCLHRVI